MSILFTSDIQVSVARLELAYRTLNLMKRAVKKFAVDSVFFLGDLKEAFNPLDYRVLKFCMEFVESFDDFHLLMGNHDRIGSFESAESFLPMLERSGAKVYTEPAIVKLGPWSFHVLPHRYNMGQLRSDADGLAKQAKANSILLFHNQIVGARSSNLLKIPEGITLQELHADKYRWLIGGDVHKPQRFGEKAMYVGSPYSMDFSEANQIKRFLLLTDDGELKPLRLRLPGHYSPDLPGFEKSKPDSWKGSKVRISVSCSRAVDDVHAEMAKAEKKAAALYPGAQVTAIPDFVDEDADTNKIDVSSDEAAIGSYVEQTLPKESGLSVAQVVAALKFGLRGQRIQGDDLSLRILRMYGKNVLSFDDFDVELPEGLILVNGRNEDWDGRSNGSGKTSALQIPVIAHCGRTFKGQKADRWIRRGSKGESFAGYDFQLADGRRGTVLRGRRPNKLKFVLDGKDLSTGRGVSETQALIETMTGLNWDAFKSVVFLDPREMFAFLYGTNKERYDIVANLQNLGRFDVARDALKQRLRREEKAVADIQTDIRILEERLQTFELVRKQETKVIDYDEAKASYEKAVQEFREAASNVTVKKKKLEEKIEDLEDTKVVERNRLNDLRSEKSAAVAMKNDRALKRSRFDKLEEACPVCQQPIDHKLVGKCCASLEEEIEEYRQKIEKLNRDQNIQNQKLEGLQEEIDKCISKIQDLEDSLLPLVKISNEAKRLFEKAEEQQSRQRFNKDQVDHAERCLKIANKALKDALANESFFRYCVSILGRDGLPGYMATLIYPRLNRAAKMYSEILTGGVIQTRFEVVDDGIVPVIVNTNGGETLDDQSLGERQLAALAASLALRDVCGRATNLFVMDEPGVGLDGISARQFADAIKKVAARFGTLFLVTHNSDIQSVLSNDVAQWTVVKSDKVSRLET